jgi:two-component system, NtrC family, sensor kinase
MVPNPSALQTQPLLTADFQRLVENVSDVYFVHDLAGRFTYLSPQFERMFGYPVADCLGQMFTPLVHPEDLAAIDHMLQQLVLDHIPHENLEMRVRHRSGHWVWILISHSVVIEEGKKVIAVQGVAKNISDRKVAEVELKLKTEQLEQTLEQLQQTQMRMIQSEKMSALGQLVAGVAHEINNPVNFIYGNLKYTQQYLQDLTQLLMVYEECYPDPHPKVQSLMDDLDLPYLLSDLPKMVSSMKMGADRIRDIVLSLRNFSRLDEAELKAANLHEGIDNTLLILQHRLKSQDARPEITVVKHYGEFPDLECYAGQLNQVFMNILGNAIDALEETWNKDSSRILEIQIETEQVESTVIVRISDNGMGIPQDSLTRLFDPFYTTKPIGKGTGMGLSISYQVVVDRHRGTLTCESKLGVGTTFVISLPRRPG